MITYPIAEIFVSPQGEGLYTGVLMTFVRLAGCSVGKKFPRSRYTDPKNPLPVYTEQCTLYDGRTFECDTNYRKKEQITSQQIIERIPNAVKHVCITGGEPLIHDLSDLIHHLLSQSISIHLETSGTINILPSLDWLMRNQIWITVSPKYNCLPEMIRRANEIKLLVDKDFDVTKLPEGVTNHRLVYIQPVNYENLINYENIKLCLELQKNYPNWRISTQMHKIWHVR